MFYQVKLPSQGVEGEGLEPATLLFIPEVTLIPITRGNLVGGIIQNRFLLYPNYEVTVLLSRPCFIVHNLLDSCDNSANNPIFEVTVIPSQQNKYNRI